ncbi:MAG: hypothetical protein ACREBC_30895, partial [Pyrinomonadaceae bacterium]
QPPTPKSKILSDAIKVLDTQDRPKEDASRIVIQGQLVVHDTKVLGRYMMLLPEGSQASHRSRLHPPQP